MDEIAILKTDETKLDFTTIVDIEKKLYDQIRNGVHGILIDLGNITYIDSRAIVLLVGFHVQCNNKNIIMGLFNLSEDVKYVFRVTNIDTILKIYADEQEAVNSLRDLLHK